MDEVKQLIIRFRQEVSMAYAFPIFCLPTQLSSFHPPQIPEAHMAISGISAFQTSSFKDNFKIMCSPHTRSLRIASIAEMTVRFSLGFLLLLISQTATIIEYWFAWHWNFWHNTEAAHWPVLYVFVTDCCEQSFKHVYIYTCIYIYTYTRLETQKYNALYSSYIKTGKIKCCILSSFLRWCMIQTRLKTTWEKKNKNTTRYSILPSCFYTKHIERSVSMKNFQGMNFFFFFSSFSYKTEKDWKL